MIDLSPETEALAQRLAEAQNVTVENAIRRALEACAHAAGVTPLPGGVTPLPGRPRDRSPEAVAARRGRLDRIVQEIASMPILDQRSPREIMDDLNAL